ncbi:MAG: hypothetical protein R6U26_00765 [Candidatus Undinarchaeales archaeon]
MSELKDKVEVDIKALEKMLDVAVEKLEHAEDKIIVHVKEDVVGRAIGPSGSVVRSAEMVLGTAIEVKSL